MRRKAKLDVTHPLILVDLATAANHCPKFAEAENAWILAYSRGISM